MCSSVGSILNYTSGLRSVTVIKYCQICCHYGGNFLMKLPCTRCDKDKTHRDFFNCFLFLFCLSWRPESSGSAVLVRSHKNSVIISLPWKWMMQSPIIFIKRLGLSFDGFFPQKNNA